MQAGIGKARMKAMWSNRVLCAAVAGLLTITWMSHAELGPNGTEAPFVLSNGETIEVRTNDIESIVLNTAENGKPQWQKPSAFGTGAWSLNLNGLKAGEWYPPKGDTPKPSLRLSQSAVVCTHESKIIVLVEAMPFILTANKDKSGTLHLNSPSNDTIRALSDWVLGGGPGNISITAAGDTNNVTKWQWQRDPMTRQTDGLPNRWTAKRLC